MFHLKKSLALHFLALQTVDFAFFVAKHETYKYSLNKVLASCSLSVSNSDLHMVGIYWIWGKVGITKKGI